MGTHDDDHVGRHFLSHNLLGKMGFLRVSVICLLFVDVTIVAAQSCT